MSTDHDWANEPWTEKPELGDWHPYETPGSQGYFVRSLVEDPEFMVMWIRVWGGRRGQETQYRCVFSPGPTTDSSDWDSDEIDYPDGERFTDLQQAKDHLDALWEAWSPAPPVEPAPAEEARVKLRAFLPHLRLFIKMLATEHPQATLKFAVMANLDDGTGQIGPEWEVDEFMETLELLSEEPT